MRAGAGLEVVVGTGTWMRAGAGLEVVVGTGTWMRVGAGHGVVVGTGAGLGIEPELAAGGGADQPGRALPAADVQPAFHLAGAGRGLVGEGQHVPRLEGGHLRGREAGAGGQKAGHERDFAGAGLGQRGRDLAGGAAQPLGGLVVELGVEPAAV
jgi:hypothetical protein